MSTPIAATPENPTLGSDPYDVREMVRRALTQPTTAAPGSTPSAPPEEVRQRILEAFVSRGIGNTALREYRARASSAGACMRALAYHRLGIPETDPPEPEIGLTLELGTLLHIYLDAVLVEFGLPVELHEHEIRVPYAYGEITGHFDRGIAGTIVDFKSASRASFDLMVDMNAPLLSYRHQVNFYLHGARLAQLPYTHGLVVAYCKDPGVGGQRTPWVSPPLAYDPDLAQQTIDMFEAVERHGRAGTLPPRPYTNPNEYPCKYCRWKGACWDFTQLSADKVADLSQLDDVIARYETLRKQVKQLELERDAAAGEIKAALIDAGAAVGKSATWTVPVSQYDRTTIDADLVPPEIAKLAGKTTRVTTIRPKRNTPAT
jgi:hypothetical protein